MLLQRLPEKHDKSLRAWDSADILLADAVNTKLDPSKNDSVLVINDQFGAISCHLGERAHKVLGDSATAAMALAINRKKNDLSDVGYSSFEQIASLIKDCSVACVVIKLPKSNSYLRQQLWVLNRILPENTVIILAGMQKYIDKNVILCIEDNLANVDVCRAEKKARMIKAVTQKQDGSLSETQYGFFSDELNTQIDGNANVFSHSKLDIGARAFIEAIPKMPKVEKVLDFACGNGVLGLAYGQFNAEAELSFLDESAQAIAAAEHNYRRVFSDKKAIFLWQDGLLSSNQRFDLILLNPPFHQGHVVGDHVAMMMFEQAAKHLNADGQLWVVGNRHLGYHKSLKRYFRTAQVQHSTAKFSVLAAKHPIA